ncbi:putative tetratricopeptide-like protein [Eutypa lata UCREL1]|uniref:Putative tetratricopeptide-like protein n=1 Tax=Eutypa lata (strain UCR-EL1) TaxID=1287681 RepID=M7SRT4_EUTLA|nr:putative tetratricopeptide-like protein [Eutypa lata UCREL1]
MPAEIKEQWKKVIDRLPRYKPRLQDESEFFSVGRDEAASLFVPSMANSDQESFSFLFCGVGDARHLFATLACIAEHAREKSSLCSKKIYFTLVDINPAVFARDMLVLRMLNDFVKEAAEDRPVTAAAISYVYATQVMPSWIYDRVQTAIRGVIGRLKADSRRALDEYIDFNWMPNMTLLDFNWEATKSDGPSPMLNFTPLGVVNSLFAKFPAYMLGPNTSGVFAHLVGFFSYMAVVWGQSKDQIQIELVLDDMVGFMEKSEFHLNVFSHVPDRFDAIHMSNIPDYVGGPLTTFLHGLPILHTGGASEMTSHVMSSALQWATHDEFLVEHLLLADRGQIENTFSAALTKKSLQIESIFSDKIFGASGAVLAQSLTWTRKTNEHLAWSQLIRRKDLELWLHMHFLKLSLPFKRPERDSNGLVYAPLNMAIFFRLITHLSRVGYPPHWLSDILDSLCGGEPITQARAPRAMIVDAAQARKVHAMRKMSIKPFVQEFRTLLAIWRPLFSFGIIPSDVELIPDLTTVREYRLQFTVPADVILCTKPVLALVFWNTRENGRPPAVGLREALLDDEHADPAYEAIRRQDGRVYVISTWEWETKTAIATFWFSEATLKAMFPQKGDGNSSGSSSGWDAYVWRTDSWTPVLGPLPITQDTLKIGDVWDRRGILTIHMPHADPATSIP